MSRARQISDANVRADRIPAENVVARLRKRLREARELGLNVRMEMLEDQQATWCEIAGVPTLFVDLSQTASEQLHQVEETLAAHAAEQSCNRSRHGADRSKLGARPEVDGPHPLHDDLSNRAA